MFPPFPQEIAHHYCLDLYYKIQSGQVPLLQVGRESLERKNQGLMLGCLVAWNKKQQKREVLYTVSGNNKILDCYNFVPSIVDSSSIDKALQENDRQIHVLTGQISRTQDPDAKSELASRRRLLTDQSLQRVFDLYNFTRFDGKKISLNHIIAKHGGRLPPAGTGDCCAPKLLSYAFEHNLQIVSMDEIYIGPDTKNKVNGNSYAPCDERCGYILPYILGLEILYRDKDIIVVNKASGLLSVPGRGEEKSDSVEKRIQFLFPDCITQSAVHRLDMETSGILVLARNKESHRALEMEFAGNSEGTEHKITKVYEALLDGILRGKPEGHIELKTRLDVENRPHQILDDADGKTGITDWKKLDVEKWKNPVTGEVKNVTRVEFVPKTGRTHQLRLAASLEKGLNLPILGDTLYGKSSEGERLMLHARLLEFRHPSSGKLMHFESKPEF